MPIQNRDGALWLATGIDNSGLYSGLNQAEGRINQFEAHIGRIGDNITRLTGIGFGVAGLKAFGSEIINVRGEMQLLETSFGVLLGNQGKANAMIAEIKQYNIQSPLSLNGISQAAQLLLGFNVEAERVMPTLKQLGDISMGDTGRFQSLALAFAQMSAAGKLMGQDLLQMINAGFNPLQEISKNTGKSLIELRKEMENGAISSQMVANAFASATAEGGKFYGMTEKQAEGIRGLQAKLEGGLIDAFNKVGKSQEGLIAGGYKVSIALVENYQAVGEALTALIATYGVAKAAMVFNTSIDKTVTLMRYDAEIAELTKLLPLKEEEANADIKAAVASGKLTQSKAKQLIALRAEIESRKESIQSKLAEEQINLKSLEARRLESVEAIKRAQAKTAAAKEELANTIATAEAEKVASLQKRMSLESERQSRAALRIIKLQEEKDAAIEQARALKESQASAEKVAAKNREIASIHAKIAVAREEEIQHGRNVSAMRNEIKAGVDVTANKKIQALTNKVNTLSEKENAAATAQTGYAKQIVGKRVLIKKLATDAETISNKINTAEQNINTTSTNFLAVAKNRAAAAAKNLWAALAPNPYVLAAAAAVALGYGIYKLATAATAAEQAQAALNKETERTAAKADEERAAIEKLLGVIKDEVSTRNQKQKSLETLQSKYPSIFKNLDAEKIKNLDLADAIRQVNIELEKRSGIESKANIDRAKELLGEINTSGRLNSDKDISDAEKLLGLEGIWERYTKTNSQIKSGLEEYISQAESKLLNNAVTASRANFDILPKDEKVSALKKDIDNLQSQYDRLKKLDEDQKKNTFTGGLSLYGTQLEAVESQINAKNAQINALEKDTEKTALKNKAYWEKIRDDQQKVMDSNLPDSNIFETAKKQRDEAAKKLEQWDKTSFKSQESAAEKAKKLQQELLTLQDKLNNEQLQQELNSQQKIIDQQEESFKKQYAQNELNYKKELQQIKEFEDNKKKEREEAVLKFGASKVPVELSVGNVKKQTDKLKEEALSSFTKSNNDVFKSLTDKYQSYADQRLEIEKKYNKDIEVLISQRDKTLTEEQRSLLNRSIAKATSDKGKELMSFDFDRLKESPEYIRAFEDLKNTSSETLNSLLAQLEEAKQTAAQVLSPDQLREYTSTIQSIMDELTERNPYKALIEKKKDLAEAGRELAFAEKQLKEVQSGFGVITSLTMVNGKLVTTYLNEADAIKNVNKAKDRYTKASNDVLNAEKKVLAQVDELSNALSGLGTNIGGTAGEIINLIGDVGLFTTTSIEGISKIADKSATAISNIEKASVILTIISTAIQLMQKLDDLMPDAYDKYEKYDRKIEEINDLRDAVNDYELAVLKAKQAETSWFGNDQLQNLKDYKDQQSKIFESYKDKILEEQAIYQNKKGGGWLTGALNYGLLGGIDKIFDTNILGNKYKEGMTAAINNLRIETRKKKSGFLGSGIGGKSQKTENLVDWAKSNLGFDLFDADGWINEDAYDVIMSKYSDKLVGQTKETLEELKALKDQYDEYLDQLHDYVGTLYEPLVDNMVDSIWDWFDEGKNALDSFKDYAKDTFRDIASDMIKTILLKDVFGDYQDNITKLYEEYSKGNLTEEQLSEAIAKETGAVMDRYNNTLPMLEKTVNAINSGIKDATGIDLKKEESSTQSSSSKGGFETITQDQAGEMNGRLTGIHETDIRIEQNTLQLILLASERNNVLKGYSEGFLAIRNVLVETRFILEEMRDSNNELYEIKDTLIEIKKNTKGLVTK